MYEISKETLENAHKPFDVVSNAAGDVGFIQEVSVNSSQPEGHQISYSVTWLVGNETKHAWFDHHELRKHCNLFMEMAKNSCHPMGRSRNTVETLFANIT